MMTLLIFWESSKIEELRKSLVCEGILNTQDSAYLKSKFTNQIKHTK